jgi:maltose O-acetyltransferase
MRYAALAAYYAIGRWLPPSDAALVGPFCKKVRGALVRRCFQYAGSQINVQRGCYFGSGSQMQLGDRSSLGVNSEVHGVVHIGKDVMMGPETMIHTRNHRTADVTTPMIDQGYGETEPVVIEDDVWVGARVIILPGVTIGTGSVIGAGSVVTRSVPSRSVAVGNPCRVVRTRN